MACGGVAPVAAILAEPRRAQRAGGAASARGGGAAEVGERGDAVGLGPDADSAGAGDVRIVELDQAPAVERDLDPRADEDDAQRMPNAGGG
jgi:hypothetical protein